MDESIGMLSPAYFASRSAILAWVNQLAGLQYTKIEQTASGVAACHVFDALFPGAVRLEKVNFSARRDFEYVHNYKVLQAAFSRVGIEKQVDVERLVKAKYQDNLEFMQWVKGFFDQHRSVEAEEYDGAARRAALGRTTPSGGGADRRGAPRVPAAGRRAAPREPAARPGAGGAMKENRRIVNGGAAARKGEFDALTAEVAELHAAVEEGDAEREFYFNKLRDIEIIIQGVEDAAAAAGGGGLDAVLAQIKAILYTTDDGAVAEGAGAEGEAAGTGAEGAEGAEGVGGAAFDQAGEPAAA